MAYKNVLFFRIQFLKYWQIFFVIGGIYTEKMSIVSAEESFLPAVSGGPIVSRPVAAFSHSSEAAARVNAEFALSSDTLTGSPSPLSVIRGALRPGGAKGGARFREDRPKETGTVAVPFLPRIGPPPIIGDDDAAGGEDASSSTALSAGGRGGLMERAISLLMRQLGVKLPEPSADYAEEQKLTSTVFHTVIGACLGTLEDSPDAACIVDLQTGLLIYCNTAMQSIFGILQKELMFRLLTDFLVLEDIEKAPFLESIRTILQHGRTQQATLASGRNFKYTGNITGRLHTGSKALQNRLEYTVSNLRLAKCLDHTDQPNQLGTMFFRHYDPRYQLGLESRIAEAVFEQCPLGIVRADFLGEIKDLNFAALAMFNFFKSRTIGQNVSIFMPKSLRQSHNLFLEAFRRRIAVNPAYSSNVVNRGKENSERILTTETWDGRTLSISLDIRVIDQMLVAFIRDRNAFVLGEEHRKSHIQASFPSLLAKKYFSNEVPDTKEGLQIDVRNKAVMSIDLVNSTEKFSEYTAKEHYQIINAFLSALDKIVSTFQGVTIKHTGDGLIAIFDPIYKEKDFAKFATLCSLSCLATAEEWSKKSPYLLKKDNGNFFAIRVGIASGDFLISMIGAARHLTDIDVIGQTVVTACRLQSVSVPNKVSIDPETFRLAKISTTKGPLRGSFERVVFPEPLKGLPPESTIAYRSKLEGLTERIKDIREKGEFLEIEAEEYEKRLLTLRS